MHISHQPLWNTLKERKMRKEDLRLAAGLTTNQIANMGKGLHMKMGLIRSGHTNLIPEDDNELTDYLWPIFVK